MLLYLTLLGASNLAWEVAQLPLFTIIDERGLAYALLAALHCTGGDLLIGGISLTLAWALFGRGQWPARRRLAVALAATTAGLLYTAFSEWMNAQVRGTWTYSAWMPLLPVLGIGVTPLLQWLLLPPLCLRLVLQQLRHRGP